MNNLEKILEEFDEQFYQYNPKLDDGIKIPIWNGSDYEALKSFISKTYEAGKQEAYEDAEEIIGKELFLADMSDKETLRVSNAIFSDIKAKEKDF